MATLSMTVELAGFQHGDRVVHIKALAFACPKTQSSGSRVFDSTGIVPNSATALRAFLHQIAHHGFSLHSPGLPPTSTGVFYKPLQTFIHQDTLLDWMEGEMPLLPKSSCGPKVSKRSIFADLLNNIHFLGLHANQEVSISGGRSARGKIMCFSFGQILDKFLILFSVRSLTRPVFS